MTRPTPSPAETWSLERLFTPADMDAFLERLGALLSVAGFSERDLFSVRLSLEEAIINSIKHGHRGDPSKAVSVRYCVTEQQLLVEIEDQGPGFNPDQVPDPRTPENLERPFGRGVFLMRHYMTWVRFNDQGNCVTLCKSRTG